MPPRRKYVRRPRRRGGRVGKKAVRKIARNVIKSMAEKKYVVGNITAQLASYDTPYVTNLTDINQGDADTDRNGDQVRMTSLELRGTVYPVSPNGVMSARLIILLVKPGNQNLTANTQDAPGLDEILQNGSSNIALRDVYRNDTKNRYQILWDRTFDAYNIGTSASNKLSFHKMFGLKSKILQFDAAASARITKNAIYLLWFSGATAASQQSATLDITYKLRFIDF